MSRITQEITYSLHNRGRNVTGKDRSNVDAQSMIHKINSAEVQEFVKNGQLIGYYGHQIRQRYGMNPPETVMIGDKIIRLEPAIRTIYLKADPDGKVTHKTEFLENDAGNHAMRQYMANVGGFSTACDYFVQPGGILVPRNFAGYDYVLQPNFVDNVGYALFDSIHADEEKELLEQRLELEIVQLYDSIGEIAQLHDMSEAALTRARKAERKLELQRKKDKRRAEKESEIIQNEFDSALCPETDFQNQFIQANNFLIAQINEAESPKTKQAQQADKMMGLLGKFIGGGRG